MLLVDPVGTCFRTGYASYKNEACLGEYLKP